MTTELFSALTSHVHKTPNKKGEVYIPCPNCGKPKAHFSFGPRGAHCFLCGYSPSLSALAEKLGLHDTRPTSAPAYMPPAPKPRPWQARASELAISFAAAPLAVQRWQAYKPLLVPTIRLHMLGYGVFPGGLHHAAGRCDHPRLIVPLLSDGAVVGFRCRAVECSCPKWLSPGGSKLALFNADAITAGAPLAIVENPADALLIGDHWQMAAVATLGVSVWNDDYTALLVGHRPSGVIIGFDNDVPGQTRNPAIIAAWKARRRARNLPDDETAFLSGIKLANRLRAAGLPAIIYDWPLTAPEKADIGSLFTTPLSQ
jgi:hypothetical protein